MNRRKQISGGQAIVMVSLSLFAMSGMMGLAVDLGWSYFVRHEAQTAADGAAIAAVQAAYNYQQAHTPITDCSSAPGLDCGGPRNCSSFASTSYLSYGCKYASMNGFDSTTNTRQVITAEANVGTAGMPNDPFGHSLGCGTAPCMQPANVEYWVTYRATQTVPQLFSALLGKTNATVAAISTGAISAFGIIGGAYATNQAGDCGEEGCGVDLHFEGSGTASRLTAPNGIYLGSICDGTLRVGCAAFNGDATAGTKTGNCISTSAPCYAIDADSNTTGIQVHTGSPIQMAGAFNPSSHITFSPSNPIIHSPISGALQDPTQGLKQPPVAPNVVGGMQGCGINGDTITGTSGNSAPLVIGPYNYYGYTPKAGNPDTITGNQIKISGNVTFAANGVCQGGHITGAGATQTSSSFPTYIFYGGLMDGAAANIKFGPGQYVVAGTQNNVLVDFNSSNISSTGNGGNMFIFTAPTNGGTGETGASGSGYPGLETQINFMKTQQANFATMVGTLNQGGDIHFESPDTNTLNLNGTNKISGNVPANLTAWDGILFWVDRRNSLVPYAADGSTPTCPTNQATACIKSATLQGEDNVNSKCDHVCGGHVELKGPAGMNLNGVIYEPRGALMEFRGDFTNQLQVIAGEFDFEDNAQIVFQTPTRTLSRYLVSLVQ